jgi:hypothetical protein
LWKILHNHYPAFKSGYEVGVYDLDVIDFEDAEISMTRSCVDF